MPQLTVGSLFSGIGGLDLGLERAGMRVIWQSEIEPFACKVLEKHWPGVPNHGDITKVDWSKVERPDVLCGGYPCQPFSIAGKRKGEADERHLWPAFRDAIRHLRPRYVILENVPGHLSLGFGGVLGDLSKLGYDAEWSTLSARDVGAIHNRERLFVVAHLRSYTCGGGVQLSGEPGILVGAEGDAPINRKERRDANLDLAEDRWMWGVYTPSIRTWARSVGRVAPPPILLPHAPKCQVCRVDDGVPEELDIKAELRTLGNAVVPQCAELVGRLITCKN